jgi:hypothetical protein
MNSAILACIDAEGYSTAFRLLTPYIKLNADWCLSNSMMFIGREPQGIEGLLEMMNWTMNMSNRGKTTYHTSPEGDLLFENLSCRTKGAFPMMCQWWCDHEFSTMCEDSNPDLKMSLDCSLYRGDAKCQWRVRRKDERRLTTSNIVKTDLVHQCRTKESLDFWAQAGPAEMMTLSTACLVEDVGKEKALILLTKRARENGAGFGAYYLQSAYQAEHSNFYSALELFNSLMNVKIMTSKITDDSWEVEIGSCPFSGVPIEVCAQIEELKKGALGIVLRDHEWTYTENCGQDGICRQRLVARPKAGNNEKSDMVQTELKRILKMRLAKGEITLSDYDILLEKLTND